MRPSEQLRFELEEVADEFGPDAIRNLCQAWRTRTDVMPHLINFDRPVLGLAGGHDQFVPILKSRFPMELLQKYGRKNVQFATIPGCGHLAPFEKPVEVADALTRFFDSGCVSGAGLTSWRRAPETADDFD